jgi:hypothetical protein
VTNLLECVMVQENSVPTKNEICEGFGCSAKSTTKISVPVGEKGSIMLFLCDNCIMKFRTDVEEKMTLM